MTGPSILAIEDDAMGRVALLSAAERLGIDITVAHSLGAASASLAMQAFDLILVEWHLVEDDAPAAVAQLINLSERFCGRRVPILAVSPFSGKADDCRSAGMDDCLTKPFRLQDLGDRLAALLEKDLIGRSRLKDWRAAKQKAAPISISAERVKNSK